MSENRYCAVCGNIIEGSQCCNNCYAKARDKGFEEGTRLAETAACCAADEAAKAYDEKLEQTFRQGYEDGMRAEATKELIEKASEMLEAIIEVVTSILSRVDISAMYDAEEAAKAYEELEEKHPSECRQISEYEIENWQLRELLTDALSSLENAFYASSKDKNEADELYDRIKKTLGVR